MHRTDSMQRSLNIDRFMYSAVSNTTTDTVVVDSPAPISITLSEEAKTDNDTCCYLNNCCGYTECYGVKWTPKTKYMVINVIAICIHLANTIAIGCLNTSRFSNIKQGYVFVSPIAQLDWTNHALVKVDASTNVCSDVSSSPHFVSTIPNTPASLHSPFPSRKSYPDFLHLFNFSDTTLIQYNRPGNELQLNHMMMCFCLLSVIFQTIHGTVLYVYEDFPRILHYIEYAFSSPLMIMVMAVNVGIKEMFIITSLAFLFFGMNVLGMSAEAIAHYAGHIEKESLYTYMEICKLTHIAGWFLFFAAMVPIWMQFHWVLECSENSGTPTYAYAAIVIESICFFLFGILQAASLMEKFYYIYSPGSTKHIPVNILFKYDCMHALLSVFAKTLLAWLLLGPALDVKTELLE